MKAKTFDNAFDDGKDISDVLDLARAKRPMQEQKRVNVDFPTWMIQGLDQEARRVGVTRQSIIKLWLAERLEQASHANSSQTPTSEDALRQMLREELGTYRTSGKK